VPVAQPDRVFGYEPKGQGFESLQARWKHLEKSECFFFACVSLEKEPSHREAVPFVYFAEI
jgi:hypothetical protein